MKLNYEELKAIMNFIQIDCSYNDTKDMEKSFKWAKRKLLKIRRKEEKQNENNNSK